MHVHNCNETVHAVVVQNEQVTMSTMEEPPPADSEPAAEEDQANGSSFMSLCLAATNRLLVEKHDVPADEQGQDVLVSGSIVPDADVDVSAPTQDCEPIMERFMCYEDIKNVTDDSILKPADVAAAAKKPKQSAVRKGTPTKGRRYVSGIRSGSKRDDQWNIMFLRLQDYKFENGTCNVPQGFAADAELATCKYPISYLSFMILRSPLCAHVSVLIAHRHIQSHVYRGKKSASILPLYVGTQDHQAHLARTRYTPQPYWFRMEKVQQDRGRTSSTEI
jgi:hypothetical protein